MTALQTDKRANYLAFVEWQLRYVHQLQISQADIWWAIYNDAGRDESTAFQMLLELADNGEALAQFALTVAPIRTSKLLFIGVPTGYRSDTVFLAFVAGIYCGVLLASVFLT
jgi:hypothetical protein